MREGLAYLAFTARGTALAERLAAVLGGTVQSAGENLRLGDWTAENFPAREGLVLIGAAGIAVRAIAPHLRHKAEDPAVVCVREDGAYVIPLLSGHLGGANALAERIAAVTGGVSVVTTATDVNGVFAVDLWARRQGLLVRNPERIKTVSAKHLRGETITIECSVPVVGTAPERVRLGSGGDVCVSWRRQKGDALQLVPRVLCVGIGCRRGTEQKTLNEAFARFCEERGVLPQAVCAAASIEQKRDEAGLRAFCERQGWPIRFYTAKELSAVEGEFTASDFVRQTVGVDNVCERAALLQSAGKLAEKKYAAEGVTFALAEKPLKLDWSW